MKHLRFPEFFEKYQRILGEGAVIERLRRNSEFDLDPHIVNSAFIYDKDKRTAISGIYRQYLDIGLKYNLPLLLSTPTWRASRERIEKAGYEKRVSLMAGEQTCRDRRGLPSGSHFTCIQ